MQNNWLTVSLYTKRKKKARESELMLKCFHLSKEKMNAYYFREDETAVLSAIKAQLPFSEGKYQLLNP